ncbi:MAG TPA: helix-turn-helix domain-containing protein [Chitinophagales bacterium]|nr:helix-turn-helix domain-containing protein [Chitinophagales bacterium]
MMEHEDLHELQHLATEFALKTSEHLFITGKAGTGKTTFLKSIQNNSMKNTVVAAPTGVAAINAGGMTLHSLFQLPFNAFLPTKQRVPANFTNMHTLFENLKLSKVKIEVMKEMELLIIDEVSMLRCDYLDCIDTILRTVRKNQQTPFGGVQVIFIGDLFQLPPVVKDDEWKVLNEYYESPFFFSAQVIRECNLLNVEFTKIYRQSEEKFIRLLNKVRNNEMDEDDFYLLNSRYEPELLSELEHYITLSTHNSKTDKINQTQLQKLESDLFEFKGELSGNFNENALPTEFNLQLKQGAQIMFIKNDSKPEKRYFNGKLATIKKISKTEITVQFFDDAQNEMVLEKEKWEDVRYSYNTATDKIEEEVVGSYVQYPIRLAWAITIHKSQGLTFENAVIDAGYAFAAGQVYVALSRCKTLNGMHLMTRISQEAITTDQRIIDYSDKYLSDDESLQKQLPMAKIEFSKTQLLKAFDWTKTVDVIYSFGDLVEEKKIPEKETVLALARKLETNVRAQKEIADKFLHQLKTIFENIHLTENQQLLQDRVVKSIHYFGKSLAGNLIQPLHDTILSLQNKKGVRGFLKKADEIEQALKAKLKQIEKLQFGDTAFYEGNSFYKDDVVFSEKLKAKPEKGESNKESLRLYLEKKSIEEIAHERNMAVSTIESHLASFISTGEVSITSFLKEVELAAIKTAMADLDTNQLTPLKQHFGDQFSFGQLRMAVAYFSK